MFNIIACVTGILAAENGIGKHIYDPSLKPTTLVLGLEWLFIAKITNVFAMLLLKASIAVFLISLDFSTTYRVIIWLSIVLVTIFNLVIPFIVIFGSCTPLEKNWNLKVPGHCWPKVVNEFSAYSQSGMS